MHEKIQLHKVNKLEQLTPLELEQLAWDADAKTFIAENQAFGELAALELTPPSRDTLLAKTFASKEQESWTPPAKRLPWWKSRHALRWAVSATLLMAVTGVLVITPSPTQNGTGTVGLSPAQSAWASEPGLVMALDAETGSEEEALIIAQELTEKAQQVFLTKTEEITRQEAVLNEAIKVLYKQRQLLGTNPPPGDGDHGLTQAEQASLKELQLNLTEVFEAIDLQSVEIERIGKEIAQQEAEIFDMLKDLHSVKGKLSKVQMYSPKHEVRQIENGMYEITVGFPGVELEPAKIAVSLNKVVNHKVSVNPAMFFVEKVAAHTNKLSSHLGHFTRVVGGHTENTNLESHTIRLPHHAPSAESVRVSLAKSAYFAVGEANLEVTTESDDGRLTVTILKDGELLHEIESNDLGEGMVWFGIPELGNLRKLDEAHNIQLGGYQEFDEIERLDSMTMVVTGEGQDGEASVDLNLSVGGLDFEVQSAGDPELEGYTRMFTYSTGDKAALVAPGIIDLSELHGKIISILGDVLEGQEIEVLTTEKDGVKVLQIVVNGEVTQEIYIKDGDCKVVVIEGEGKREE